MKDKNSPSRRILVVDDDIAFRNTITNFLEEMTCAPFRLRDNGKWLAISRKANPVW